MHTITLQLNHYHDVWMPTIVNKHTALPDLSRRHHSFLLSHLSKEPSNLIFTDDKLLARVYLLRVLMRKTKEKKANFLEERGNYRLGILKWRDRKVAEYDRV